MKKRAPSTKKSEQQINEGIAVECCSTLKKSLNKNDYTAWDEVGFGDSCRLWFQIKGLMNGNNIAICKEGDGKKKRYILQLVSKQGTNITSEFDTFNYTHSNNKLHIIFSLGDKITVSHDVIYGGEI